MRSTQTYIKGNEKDRTQLSGMSLTPKQRAGNGDKIERSDGQKLKPIRGGGALNQTQRKNEM